MIPDLNSLLPSPNPTWTNMAALADLVLDWIDIRLEAN